MASILFLLVLVFSHFEFSASAHASSSGDCKTGACSAQIEIDDATAMIQRKAEISLHGQISDEDVMLLTKSAGVGHFLEVKGIERLAAAQKMESSMETAVTKMIDGQGRLLPLDVFVSINRAMEELRGDLFAEKETFQTSIHIANGAVAKCNENMQDTLSGGVATAKGIVDDDKETHHACRGAELSAYDAKNASCELLTSKTTMAADAAPDCNCKFSKSYTTSDVLTCLANNGKWVKDNEKNLIYQQSDCNNKTTTWSTKAAACDTNQSNYEVAVCIYAEKLENMCSTLDTCYNDKIASRSIVVQSVKSEEKHLKAVLASAKKIACYLSIIKKANTTKITHSELDACLGLDVLSDKTYLGKSVHDLNINYPPADNKINCKELHMLKSWPGDGEWAADEYKQYTKEWLRETALCSHKAQATNVFKVLSIASEGGYFRYDHNEVARMVGSTGGGWVSDGVTSMTIRNVRTGKEGMSVFTYFSGLAQGRFGCHGMGMESTNEYKDACRSTTIRSTKGDWQVGDLGQIIGVCGSLCKRGGRIVNPTCVPLPPPKA